MHFFFESGIVFVLSVLYQASGWLNVENIHSCLKYLALQIN